MMAPSSSESATRQQAAPTEAAWFWCRTAHGGKLACDQAGNLKHAASPALACDVMLFRPRRTPEFGFLFAADDAAPGFNRLGSLFPGRILPLRIVAAGQAGLYGLAIPGDGAFLSALPAAEPDGMSSLATDRQALHAWETFTLEAAPRAAGPSAAVKRQADAVALWLEAACAGPEFAKSLLAASELPDFDALSAVLQAMPDICFANLAHDAARNPALAFLLARSAPGDVWLSRGLPALAAWNVARDPAPSLLSVGTDLNRLAGAGMDGCHASVGHRLNATARRTIAPRAKAAVLATARNEGSYLVEWIAYHRAVGADAIFIYSNDNADGSDGLLAALAQAGIITWLPSLVEPGCSPQNKAYGHAFGLLPSLLDYEWALVIDLDEFFCFDNARFSSLPDYIDWQSRARVDAIQLQWLIFSSAGLTEWTGDGAIGRFPRRRPYVDMHVKSLCRPRLFMQSQPHVPVCDQQTAPVVRSSDGSLLAHCFGGGMSPLSNAPVADHAWINHYFFRSAEEMLIKWSRNRGNHPATTNASFQMPASVAQQFLAQHHDPANVQDERIHACAPTLADEIAGILALPGVAQACRAVKAKHRFQIDQARAALLRPQTPHPPDSAAALFATLFDQG